MKYNNSWFGLMSRSALSGLYEYYQRSESLIEAARKADLSRIKGEVDKIGGELTEEQRYSEWNLLIGEHEAIYDIFFTNYFRYSCIVLFTLFLEDHLSKLSWALYNEKGHPESPPNPTVDIINKYREYIDSFGLFYNNTLWDFVDDLKSIRNCLVHASGDVSRRSPVQQLEIDNIVNKNIGIHKGDKFIPLYLDDDMIIIEPRYCEVTIFNITSLFEALCKAAGLPLEIEFENS